MSMTHMELADEYKHQLKLHRQAYLDEVNTLKRKIRQVVGRASLNTRTFIEKEKRGSALISLDDLDNQLNKLTEVNDV
jgi:hypothetical protein